MSFPRYREYKDSGVEWLGEVPEHWFVGKVKHITSFFTGWTPPTGNAAFYEGENPWANISDLGPKWLAEPSKRISDEAVGHSGIRLSPTGSLLFSFKLSIGQVSFAARDMYTNEAIATFPPSERLNLAFAYYALPLYVVQNASENIYGAKLLNQELIKAASVAVPSIHEQTAIATFLDRETAKIDALVAEQEKLIALLQEKRQAVISHAVTKGLDPNVPMKDSGVEWLGEVPAHWFIKALKHVCDVRDGTHDTPQFLAPAEDTFPFVTTKDLGNGRVSFDEAKHISRTDYDDFSRRSRVDPGDVLMPMIGSIGGAVLVDTSEPFAIKNIALFKRSDRFDPRWLAHFLNSSISSLQFDLNRSGGVQGFVALSVLRDLCVPVPPKVEQVEIAENLSKALASINELMNLARGVIATLQERRTALISAAVTGQIDVRGLAGGANAPDSIAANAYPASAGGQFCFKPTLSPCPLKP